MILITNLSILPLILSVDVLLNECSIILVNNQQLRFISGLCYNQKLKLGCYLYTLIIHIPYIRSVFDISFYLKVLS